MVKKRPKDKKTKSKERVTHPYSLNNLKLLIQISAEPVSFDTLKNGFGNIDKMHSDLQTLLDEGFLLRDDRGYYKATHPYSALFIARIKTPDPKIRADSTGLTLRKGGKDLDIPFPVIIKRKLLKKKIPSWQPGERIAIRLERKNGIEFRAENIIGTYSKGQKPRLYVDFKTVSSVRDKTLKEVFGINNTPPKNIRLGKIYPAAIPEYFDPEHPTLDILNQLIEPDSGVKISHIIATRFGIDMAHGQQALKEVKRVKNLDPVLDPYRRILTEPFLAIDPADAKDHDDAIHVEKIPGGWRTVVAIADVAAYVHPGSHIDREARERGFTHYFEDDTFHMLPAELTRHLSLTEGAPKAVIYIETFYDEDFNQINVQTGKGVIDNQIQVSYGEFQDWVDSRGIEFFLPGRSSRLQNWAHRRNLDPSVYEQFGSVMIDMRRGSDELIFDGDSKREDHPFSRALVECLMRETNVAVADVLQNNQIPFLRRVHAARDNEVGYRRVMETLRTRGYSVPIRPADFTRHTYARLLNDAQQRYERSRVEGLIRQHIIGEGQYSTQDLEHFGLDIERYTHATSPIRRYADLQVQRGLHSYLSSDASMEQTAQAGAALEDLARHLNNRQRVHSRAAKAAPAFFGIHKLMESMSRGCQQFNMSVLNISREGVEISWEGQKGMRKWLKREELPPEWQISSDETTFFYRSKIPIFIGGRVKVTVGNIDPQKGEWTLASMIPAKKQPRSMTYGEGRRRHEIMAPQIK